MRYQGGLYYKQGSLIETFIPEEYPLFIVELIKKTVKSQQTYGLPFDTTANKETNSEVTKLLCKGGKLYPVMFEGHPEVEYPSYCFLDQEFRDEKIIGYISNKLEKITLNNSERKQEGPVLIRK